ncbi:TssN family type VI secretion system protein [Spirosoma sp.]|uniref:TssN family type VI secretion system protein n=1 Tax=Spirosoma sp. TaxID=1899569 RepID=UPI00261B5AD3|nr:TssN family type VI secretion system protein [Spirosoma sp.]MCX6216958.1 TssN family type VI secretion system protein [Spirosoma sp.]
MNPYFNPQNEARTMAGQVVGQARSNLSRNVPVRNTILYMLVVFFVFCGVGYLGYLTATTLFASSGNAALWTYTLILGVVLLLGVLHANALRWAMPWIAPDNYLLGTLMTLLMGIFGGLALFLVSFSPNMFGWGSGTLDEAFKIHVRPLVTTVPAFLIAYFVQWAFDAFNRIPPKIYKVWKYDPLMPRPRLSESDLKRLTDIVFVVDIRLGERNIYDIVSDIPDKLSIGQAFQLAVDEHNRDEPKRQIEVRDPYNPDPVTNLYEWHFYVQRPWWRGNLYIDPERNCPENYVINGHRIIIRRLTPGQ